MDCREIPMTKENRDSTISSMREQGYVLVAERNQTETSSVGVFKPENSGKTILHD